MLSYWVPVEASLNMSLTFSTADRTIIEGDVLNYTKFERTLKDRISFM